MGWAKGKGLGKDGQGRANPVEASAQQGREGLASKSELKAQQDAQNLRFQKEKQAFLSGQRPTAGGTTRGTRGSTRGSRGDGASTPSWSAPTAKDIPGSEWGERVFVAVDPQEERRRRKRGEPPSNSMSGRPPKAPRSAREQRLEDLLRQPPPKLTDTVRFG